MLPCSWGKVLLTVMQATCHPPPAEVLKASQKLEANGAVVSLTLLRALGKLVSAEKGLSRFLKLNDSPTLLSLMSLFR